MTTDEPELKVWSKYSTIDAWWEGSVEPFRSELIDVTEDPMVIARALDGDFLDGAWGEYQITRFETSDTPKKHPTENKVGRVAIYRIGEGTDSELVSELSKEERSKIEGYDENGELIE